VGSKDGELVAMVMATGLLVDLHRIMLVVQLQQSMARGKHRDRRCAKRKIYAPGNQELISISSMIPEEGTEGRLAWLQQYPQEPGRPLMPSNQR